jgi:ATP-dependent Clp endopeptidase proteolytic subunit ClpP
MNRLPSKFEFLVLSILLSLGVYSCTNRPAAGPDVKSLPTFSAPTGASPSPEKNKKNVVKLILPQNRTVIIYGEINQSHDATVNQLLQLGLSEEPIYIILKSPGGNVINGAMIISAMEAAKGPVYTICDTLCASMAAMIFEYGTGRYIVDRSFVMFHPASGGVSGSAGRVASRLNSIQRFMGKMEAYVAQRANITFERYKQLSGVELWIDGEDAVNTGFADVLVSYILPPAFTGMLQGEDRDYLNNKVFGTTLSPRTVELEWKNK